MLTAGLGQDITAPEVVTELRSRGYYPAPTTPPPPESPPLYNMQIVSASPPIRIPATMPLSPYLPFSPSVSPPALIVPDPPIIPISPGIFDRPISTQYPPFSEPAYIPDLVLTRPPLTPSTPPISLPVLPGVILPDFPAWSPALSPALPPTWSPPLAQELPLDLWSPPVSLFPALPSAIYDYEEFPYYPPETPPYYPAELLEKKSPWLLFGVLAAVVVMGGKEKPRKRSKKRVDKKGISAMRKELGI